MQCSAEHPNSELPLRSLAFKARKSIQDDSSGKWSFVSSLGFFCEKASDTARGKILEEKASELVAAEAEAVPQAVLKSQTTDDHESFADREATETTCALFKSIMTEIKVQAIETDTSFWQINWCHAHPPGKRRKFAPKTTAAFECQ